MGQTEEQRQLQEIADLLDLPVSEVKAGVQRLLDRLQKKTIRIKPPRKREKDGK